jgi:CHAT domain-containing protein
MERISRVARLLSTHAQDEYLIAVADMRIGDALRVQGRNREAVDAYDAARAAFLRQGRRLEAARVMIGWTHAAARIGRLDEALAAYRSARRELLAFGETQRVASLDLNTGNIYSEFGRLPEALRRFTSALKLHRSLGDASLAGVARAQVNRGTTLIRLGRYREGLSELEEGRDTLYNLGLSADVARGIRSIGEQQMYLGQYAAALRSFESVLPAFRDLSIDAGGLLLTTNIAECYLQLGRPADALAFLESVDLSSIDEASLALGIVTRRVAALIQLERHEEALRLIDETEDGREITNLEQRSWLAAQRAVLLEETSPAEALLAAGSAEDFARAAGMRRLETDALIAKGRALLALGDAATAAKPAARSHRLARLLGAPPLLHRSSELLGMVAEASGESRRAIQRYKAAIEALERVQSSVIFEFRDTFALNKNLSYERLALLLLDAGRPGEAFATAERAKSRALFDAITRRIDLRPRGTPEARRLARELDEAREEYAALAGQAAHPEGQGQPTDSPARLRALENEIAQLVQRLQLSAGAGFEAELQGSPPELDRSSIPAGTAILEFFFSGQDVLRFFVTRSGLKGERLDASVGSVERLVRAFRLNLRAAERAPRADLDRLTQQSRELLSRLHALLLSGLDGLEEYDVLVVIPHGVLHYLPFQALFDGESYLLDKTTVVYAPSAALYEVTSSRARRTRKSRSDALVLGHSAGGRLMGALEEANAVAEVLGTTAHLESGAVAELLRTRGRLAPLVHIAAHAGFRPDTPLFSAIELADGPLTVADIFELELQADIVSLSACETGRAALGGGDELVGLVRAFLYTGVAGLVVSQWRVEDETTAALMKRFYGEVAQGRSGGQALRAAQLAQLERDAPQNGYSHPFYWAGFQFVGAGRTRRIPRG